MADAQDQGKQKTFEHLRTKVNRSLILVIFTAIGPLVLAGFYMAGSTPEVSSWHTTLLLTVIIGFAGAWFMGNKLMSGMLDALHSTTQSEGQLRRLMELSGDWYWHQDSTHTIVRIIYRGKDQKHVERLGKSSLPFDGLARWDIEGLKCIDPRYNWDSFKQLLDNHQPFDRVAFEYWPKDSERIIFESTGRPLFNSRGAFTGYMGVSTDRTQKRLNEQLLSLQRSLLQGVLLSAPIPELAASYARGLKTCLTVHAEVVLGFRDRSVNNHWRVRGTHPELRMPFAQGQALWDNAEKECDPIEGHDQPGLVWLGRLKQEQFLEDNWKSELGISTVWLARRKAIEPNQPEYWIMVAQQGVEEIGSDDVVRILTAIRLLGLCVERRVFEDDLQGLNATLEQRINERTAELTRTNSELEAFTYTVSHDLRAPLRAIDGFSSILKEDFADSLPDDARSLLDRISNNARQMGGLIDGLLDFSRLLRTDVARVKVDQQQMLDQILDQLDAKRKNVVEVCDLPTVYADPVLLKQVWMNLIDNALKFSAKTTQPKVAIRCEKLGPFYSFSVQDNGAGFDMKYSDKLFNVFERLHHKKDFDGTGVGLAIVKRIIERHGGQITAQAEPGQGACFTFTLPEQEELPELKDYNHG